MLRLSIANLKANLLSTTLSLMLLSLGIGMVSFVIIVSSSVEDRFSRDIRGIDMVVGAKGSPLQLILSAIYQIDSPTGNIPLEEARRLKKNPLVKYTIPLAYGDSYQGFRIVGTEHIYLEHFSVSMAEGRKWEKGLEVVVGSEVAKRELTRSQLLSSKAEVGSSAKTMAGFVAKARAMEVRCLSPMLKVAGNLSAFSATFNSVNSSMARVRLSLVPANRCANNRFSRMVMERTNKGCWNTIPIFLPLKESKAAEPSLAMSVEFTSTIPDDGCISPAKR